MATTAAPRSLGGANTTQMGYALGGVLMILGAAALIPSAMGVAQYTEGPRRMRRNNNEYAIYVTQAVILTLAVIAIISGAIVLILQSQVARLPAA